VVAFGLFQKLPMNLPIQGITISLLLSYAVLPTVSHPYIAQLTDTLIVPGERVGKVTKNTSEQDLIKLFGTSHLVDKTIPGAEGEGSNPATQVNLSQGRSLLIVWRDSTRSHPAYIKILGPAWKTPEGIGIGTPLGELRRKLGDFKLYGLGWDYSGTILLQSSHLSRYQGKLVLQVGTTTAAANKFPQNYKAVSGEKTFSAADPHWKPLDVKITQMTVILP
jgi:hypothetical protein